MISVSIGARPPVTQLAIRIDADGRADAHGAVRLWPDSGHDRPGVLVSRDASAACADTNGDGVAGLIRLVMRFVDVGSGGEVIGVMTPSNGEDITDFGQAILLLVGDDVAVAVDVEVRALNLRATPSRPRVLK